MNFIEGTREAVRTGLCNYLSDVGKGRSWLNELSPVDLPDFGNFWNRVLCDRNEPLPAPPPPFTGGQCPGVPYTVSFQTRVYPVSGGSGCPPDVSSVTTASGIGPVTLGPLTTADFDPFINYQQRWIFADGESSAIGNSQLPECPEPAVINVSVARTDGQPDNCGDPTPDPPPFPPQGDTTNVTINYVNNEGDNVTELGDLTIFAPVVIAPVTVVAPIRVDLPDVSFNGNVTLSPEFSIELNPPSFRRGPGESEEPPNPEVPSTDPTTPEDDDSRELIGAITVVTGGLPDGPATQLFGGGGPDLFVPRVGTLTFRVRAANALSWSEPLDIKLSTQFHPAPENVQAIAAVVQPYSGYTISVTPVYRDSRA